MTKHCCFCGCVIDEDRHFYICQIHGMKDVEMLLPNEGRGSLGEAGATAYFCGMCRSDGKHKHLLNNLIQGNWSQHSKRGDTT